MTSTPSRSRDPSTSAAMLSGFSQGLMSDPRYIQFGNVPPNTSTTRAVYLRTAPDDKAWKVIGVKVAVIRS